MATAGPAIVVTGAGGGIGRACAELLASRGFEIAVWDIDDKAARATVERITAAGGRAAAAACDVSDRAAVRSAVQATVHVDTKLFGILNNAGVDKLSLFADSDPNDWHRIIDVNLLGVLNVTHALLPQLRRSGAGRVVSISSDAARVGSTGEAVYSAAKAGVLGFTKTLARELAREGITVNAVCPGPTDTALLESVRQGPRGDKIVAGLARAVPLGRIAEPRDIAGAAAFFFSDDAAYVTGQTLSVSGGLTMV